MSFTQNQTPRFSRLYKKLNKAQIVAVHLAMDIVMDRPSAGTQKQGDLSHLFVIKFKLGKEEWLLGYTYNHIKKLVTWHSVGHHENFYRDAKR